ncbi:MAG: permease [Fusobacteriota bacterium]
MKEKLQKLLIPILFFGGIIISSIIGFAPGKGIGINFVKFFKSMISFLPAVFIMIGLFEVFVDKKTIEKHLGEDSKFHAYLWAILLSGTTVGGLFVAFPVAHSLYKKGAKISIIFTYIGAAAVARVPMTLFEASYVGLKFTIIRLSVSLPFIIISSILLEKYLKNSNFKIKKVA